MKKFFMIIFLLTLPTNAEKSNFIKECFSIFYRFFFHEKKDAQKLPGFGRTICSSIKVWILYSEKVEKYRIFSKDFLACILHNQYKKIDQKYKSRRNFSHDFWRFLGVFGKSFQGPFWTTHLLFFLICYSVRPNITRSHKA